MTNQMILSPKVRARATEVSEKPGPAAAPPPPPVQPPPAAAPISMGTPYRARASASAGAERPVASARAMGQAAATVPQAAVQAPVQTAQMSLDEATSMLPGLKAAIDTTDGALKSGAVCPGIQAADMDLAKTYRDQMSAFVTAKVAGSTLTVQKNWLDAADKIVRCAIEYEKPAPNTGAYIALGVIAAGAILALTV